MKAIRKMLITVLLAFGIAVASLTPSPASATTGVVPGAPAFYKIDYGDGSPCSVSIKPLSLAESTLPDGSVVEWYLETQEGFYGQLLPHGVETVAGVEFGSVHARLNSVNYTLSYADYDFDVADCVLHVSPEPAPPTPVEAVDTLVATATACDNTSTGVAEGKISSVFENTNDASNLTRPGVVISLWRNGVLLATKPAADVADGAGLTRTFTRKSGAYVVKATWFGGSLSAPATVPAC